MGVMATCGARPEKFRSPDTSMEAPMISFGRPFLNSLRRPEKWGKLMSGNVTLSSRLIRSLYSTYRIIFAYGKIKLSDLMNEAHVGKSQLYEHLRILERAGLIRRDKSDRHAYVYVEKYVTKDEFVKLITNLHKTKDVYDVAIEILSEIKKYGLRADVFGTCKIHLEVLQHGRMTDDINIVVLRDDFNYIELLLKSMGFVKKGESLRLSADYVYELPKHKVYALVAIDGIKHPYKNKRIFDLSPVLRAKGRIDLEHAVVGKLIMIPSLRRDLDGEDVSYALAYGDVDPKKLLSILQDVISNEPDLLDVVLRNIELVREYLSARGLFDDYATARIKNVLSYIEHYLPSEQRSARVSETV